MEIRFAHAEDIPGMLELLRQVGDVHHEIRPDIFRTGALKYDENALKTILADETKPIFVAADNGFVAGYCFCVLKDHRGSGVQTDRVELYIDDLCVDEGSRGRGIATALYDHVCTVARQLGCRFVTLNVWCGNDTAMAFYQKCGLRNRSILMEMPLEETQC
jgi:ribosomal protein S18 acetylase RimI-like enzyme